MKYEVDSNILLKCLDAEGVLGLYVYLNFAQFGDGDTTPASFEGIAAIYRVDFDEIMQVYLRLVEAKLLPDPLRNEPRHGEVYLLRGAHGYYKIGRSKKSESRKFAIELVLPFEVQLVHSMYADNYVDAEHWWHRFFWDRNTNGEWFLLSDQDVKFFCQFGTFDEKLIQEEAGKVEVKSCPSN